MSCNACEITFETFDVRITYQCKHTLCLKCYIEYSTKNCNCYICKKLIIKVSYDSGDGQTRKKIAKIIAPFLKLTNGKYIIYQIPVREMARLTNAGLIRVWHKNRDVDELRVEEISKLISIKKVAPPGLISMAYPKEGEPDKGLVCYDGEHRRLALLGNAGLQLDVLVSVMWNVEQQVIVDEFNLINKSVSVPEIYLEMELDPDVKTKIVAYIDKLCREYPEHRSTK